jgi:phage repressor protein C with HTH and peptisase S24 domain
LFVEFVGMDEVTPDALRRLREAKGWSQGRVADEARALARADNFPAALTQQSIANYESGKAKRHPAWLRYVVAALSSGGQRIRSEVQPLPGDPRAMQYGETDLPMIPLLGTAMAGEYSGPEQHIELTELDLSESNGFVSRPQSLKDDGKAYAVTIVGDSMWPRFRPGRRVIVSPRASISIGDDVIVQLLGAEDPSGERRVAQVLIKELVRRSASHTELRQFNPDVTFKVPAPEIASMHKVVGEIF